MLRSLSLLLFLPSLSLAADDLWLTFPGGDGPGKGKTIVFVSGDEEYRTEQSMPQLAKILSKHHGFKCIVLFAIDPKTKTIAPAVNDNIPGLEQLADADLMVIGTRWRNLPDEQMKPIIDYAMAGKPIVGIRTATHAFELRREDSNYKQFSSSSKVENYKGGFGRVILGETWVAHHGQHGSQGTRGIIVPEAKESPILRGIEPGSIFGTTDVYTVHLAEDRKPLVMGAVTDSMEPDSKTIPGPKNDPMMPVAWTQSYQLPGGKKGIAFTTTMGGSQDFLSEGTRRMFVNACYWALGMETTIPEKSNVDLVGDYQPTPFGSGKEEKGVKPSELK